MPTNIIIFGQLTDITGSGHLMLNSQFKDTDALLKELNRLFPALANARFVVAVDKQTINGNTILNNDNSVALLPPFSGG